MTNALREAAKVSVRAAAALLGRHRWPAVRPRLLVLMYHRVLPDGHPDLAFMQPGMVTRTATFAMHLRLLAERFEVVRLDDWVRRVRSHRPVPRNACAITFDDGWRDTFEHAYPLLHARGLPASVFVVSDMLGTAEHFFPERLARVVTHPGLGSLMCEAPTAECEWLAGLGVSSDAEGPPDCETVDRLIGAAKAYPDDDVLALTSILERRLGITEGERALMSWEDVQEMCRSGLIDIGSHTRRHVRMHPALAEQRLLDEVAGSARVIADRCGISPTLFCYPNGDWTPQAIEAVRAHYAGACSTIPGWNGLRRDLFLLRRMSIHDDITNTATGFLARLSGWV